MGKGFDGVPSDVVNVIKQHMKLAAGAGAPGVFLPLVDEAAIAALWGRMFYKIGQWHQVTLTASECTKIGTACIAGVFAYKTGSRILTLIVSIVTLGLAVPAAIAGNVALNAIFTRQVGLAFHKMLDTDGINGKTAIEIGKILLHYFNPFPSFGEMKDIIKQVRSGAD